MRIIINASAVSAVKGGASFYIVNITRAIAATGHPHDIIVVCTASGASLFSSIPGIDKCIPCAPKNVLLRLVWEQFVLPFTCRRHKADILFSPNYTMPLLSRGFRNVVTIHDLSFFPLKTLYPRSRRLFKPIIQAAVVRADAIIAVSEFTRNDILKFTKGTPDRISIVYNAADSRFTPSSPANAGDSNIRQHYGLVKPYILFTGFLEPRKNLSRLLLAFGMIISKIPHDLVIAGGNGWWYESLPETIKNSGSAERVRLLGYVPDDHLPPLYREAEIFAFVSLYEGFGIAALEAISCGTPVLASDNTALPEVVGDAGVYVDPYNPEDIAKKLLVVTDKNAMNRLRSNCPAVASRFGWNKAASETLSAFERVCSSVNRGCC